MVYTLSYFVRYQKYRFPYEFYKTWFKQTDTLGIQGDRPLSADKKHKFIKKKYSKISIIQGKSVANTCFR